MEKYRRNGEVLKKAVYLKIFFEFCLKDKRDVLRCVLCRKALTRCLQALNLWKQKEQGSFARKVLKVQGKF